MKFPIWKFEKIEGQASLKRGHEMVDYVHT